MCIVVDPPLFIPLLKITDPEHTVFAPVLNWVQSGHGKFVMGGTLYKTELRKISSVLRMLQEFERLGKIVRIADATVDGEEAHVKAIEPCKDFDDPHLVALIRVTKCKLICVRDPRAHKFLRSVKLYAEPKQRPSLYTRAKNKGLLCPNNIATCCK